MNLQFAWAVFFNNKFESKKFTRRNYTLLMFKIDVDNAKDIAAGCMAATGHQCTKRLPTLEDSFSVDVVNTIYQEQ